MAFGGRFDVTGLIPADQYWSMLLPLLHNQKPQLTKGLLQKVCNTSELNVNK
jgi:hypothetical protein